MIRFYILGVSILFCAIVANGLAQGLGLKTWYDFLGLLVDKKVQGLGLSLWDGLWLFLAYPLILGASAFLGEWMFKYFQNI